MDLQSETVLLFFQILDVDKLILNGIVRGDWGYEGMLLHTEMAFVFTFVCVVGGSSIGVKGWTICSGNTLLPWP